MDESKGIKVANNKEDKEIKEILSKTLRAGKRTYFFDLKASRRNEPYFIITESKRCFNENDGTFFYEKHKIFIQKEDMQSFYDELGKMMDFMIENSGSTVEPIPEDNTKNIE